MALIKCSECQAEISSKAASCPRCGNPTPAEGQPANLPANRTTDFALSVTSGVAATSLAIGFVGLIMIFIFFPVGLVMLMVAGAFGSKKNQVPAVKGGCPYCQRQIHMVKTVAAADCPYCKGRVINEPGYFLRVGGEAPQTEDPLKNMTDEQLVAHLGIVKEGGQYCYGGYRYTKLDDALNYANRQAGAGR